MSRIQDHIAQSDVVIFDCDGVLMDSNPVKEEAFVHVTETHFGRDAGAFIREFHRQNGGVPRIVKFKKVMDSFKPFRPVSVEQLSEAFEQTVASSLLQCRIAARLDDVLGALARVKKTLMVLSAAPEESLKILLAQRNMSARFERILGAPKTKIEHLKELHESGVLAAERPFVFIGDSAADLLASQSFPNAHFWWSMEFAKDSHAPWNQMIKGLEFILAH